MSYELKFGYITGFNLVFSAYQPDGSARGEAYQPLPEKAQGYYGASPATDLVAGDEVIAFVADYVLWENEQVYVLAFDYIFWEGELVNYEGDVVYAGDETELKVTYLGAVVGAQEYEKPADWYDLLSASLTTISISVGSIGATESLNESGLTQSGEPRTVISGTLGYVEEVMKEI